MIRDHVALAMDYAHDAVEGNIPVCKYVRQACQRQIDDVESGVDGYSFDGDRAAHACRFIEKLPHIKGEWAKRRELIELSAPWIFILVAVFGWIDNADRRRFKTAYVEVPRKNAKSTVTAGIGLYLLSADGEEGAEVYSAATTRDQARIVWRDAKHMVDRSQGMQRRFRVDTSAHAIFVGPTASSFKPLSRDQGGNHDGLNIHGGLIDELHAHKTRDLFDVIETGTGSREQPLLWLITTAGSNRAGICYEQRDYVTRMLSGVTEDHEYFGIIYTVDDDDLADEERLLTDPTLWAKANPNWGISVNPEDIARKARKALELPSARPNFLTKHLNVWVNADSSWMDMIAWDECGNRALQLEDFAGGRAWMGVDLASKIDIAAIYILVEKDSGFYGFSRNYLPEDAAEESRNSQYAGWVRQGVLTTTPGNVTDYTVIEEDIIDIARLLDVQSVAYDPFQATYIATRLMDQGVPMVEYRQIVANMSESMKQVQADVLSGSVEHDANPLMTWMISNVVAHTDVKDNIYPRKQFPENKIDGPVAMIMARGMAMTQTDDSANNIGIEFI